MRILVFGGTMFVGRAFVEHALAEGHELTLFNRGSTNPGLFPDVEHVRGDRDVSDDLDRLRDRSFDLVVDPSSYFPRQIDAVLDALGDRIGHYVFVSSISAYASYADDLAPEDSELATVDDPAVESLGPSYGGFKALCEQRCMDRIPDRSTIVRPGLVVGRYDNTGRFAYWVDRIAQGGTVLAPEPPACRRRSSTFATLPSSCCTQLEPVRRARSTWSPPRVAHTLASLLEDIRSTTGSSCEFTWVGEGFLVEQGIEPYSELPLWIPVVRCPTMPGLVQTRRIGELPPG